MACDVQPSKNYDHGKNPFYVTVQGTDGEAADRLDQALRW
jgi:hypothetical protein